jgi:hypothetical protein
MASKSAVGSTPALERRNQLIPGHLLGPFRWAVQPLASIIQCQPTLLNHLFAIDRPRMHVIALGLAHITDSQAAKAAQVLFTAPIREAVHSALGRCPAGLPGVLHRLPFAVLSRDGYQQLINLLDDSASAKLLYHFKEKEIAEWMITVLHDAPLALRPGLTAVVPHLALLDNVSASLAWLAGRGAAPSFDGLVGPIPEVTRFARILRSGYPPTVGGSPVYWPFVSLI